MYISNYIVEDVIMKLFLKRSPIFDHRWRRFRSIVFLIIDVENILLALKLYKFYIKKTVRNASCDSSPIK